MNTCTKSRLELLVDSIFNEVKAVNDRLNSVAQAVIGSVVDAPSNAIEEAAALASEIAGVQPEEVGKPSGTEATEINQTQEVEASAALVEVASLASALIDSMPELVMKTHDPAPAGTLEDVPVNVNVGITEAVSESNDALAAGELVVEQVPEVEGCRIEKQIVDGELNISVIIDHVLTNGTPVTPMEEAFANAKPLRRQ